MSTRRAGVTVRGAKKKRRGKEEKSHSKRAGTNVGPHFVVDDAGQVGRVLILLCKGEGREEEGEEEEGMHVAHVACTPQEER